MASIFTKIINREIPAHIVAENDDFIAILDINPNTKGHTLCIPKKEVDKILDLDDQTYLELMVFSKKVGQAIKACIPCKRVGLSVIGLEVPHVHVHLIPLQSMEDARFIQKTTLSQDEFTNIASTIRAVYNE